MKCIHKKTPTFWRKLTETDFYFWSLGGNFLFFSILDLISLKKENIFRFWIFQYNLSKFLTNILYPKTTNFNFDINRWNRRVWLLITIFMLLLVNNVVQKMRTQVINTISLYKLTNALLLLICFKLVIKTMKLC